MYVQLFQPNMNTANAADNLYIIKKILLTTNIYIESYAKDVSEDDSNINDKCLESDSEDMKYFNFINNDAKDVPKSTEFPGSCNILSTVDNSSQGVTSLSSNGSYPNESSKH